LCGDTHFNYRAQRCFACERLLFGPWLAHISRQPFPDGFGSMRAFIRRMIAEPWGRSNG
jgi:hypothetical protein